jgi:iron complex transport system substrate-binding protein
METSFMEVLGQEMKMGTAFDLGRIDWEMIIMARNKLLILALLSLVFAIAMGASAQESKYPMTVVDSAGRDVTLTEPTERVIVLNTDAAEAVSILNASDMIVGLTEGIKENWEFQRLEDIPSVGIWTDIDYEMMETIAHNGSQGSDSDIIVLGYVAPGRPYGVEAVSNNLESLDGIPALGLDFYKEDNLSREMTLLGFILDKEDEAKTVLDWHDGAVAEVGAAIEGLDQPTVFVEGSSTGLGEISTFGNQSGTGMLLEMAGGDNVMKEMEAYPKVDWEWVISQNPDVIIKTDYLVSSDGLPGWSMSSSNDTENLEEIYNDILSRPGAENISAVKNNRVYIISAQSLFGLDNVMGLQNLAMSLYPQLDLSPEEVYSEYLQFMGLEDISGNRTFVYPEKE